VKPDGEGTPYAELAARALAADEASFGAPSPRDRADGVAAIAEALRARGRRRVRPWLAAAGALAAAAAVVVVVGGRPAGPPPRAVAERSAAPAPPPRPAIVVLDAFGASLEVSGQARAALARDEIGPGARLRVAPAGEVTLAFATGTRLGLAGGASLRVRELAATQRFALEDGAVDAEVAKLQPGRRFLVDTPDAQVEVKGTRFEVAVGSEPAPCAPHVRTRVTVSEGVVVVRHASGEVRLPAGAVWPACEQARAPVVSGPARRSTPAPRHHRASREAAARTEAPAVADAPPGSTLAEQNDLFAAALAAGRRGDLQEAVYWLDQLLARYPTGQLSDSARATRRRFLAEAADGAP
jgi:ferric-dicitrate binding protein FerR (iron transport regulator)